MLRIGLQPDTQQGGDGYVAGDESPCQEDVPQDGGDEAIKVGGFHLQTDTTRWPCDKHTASEMKQLCTHVVFKAQSNHGEMANVVRTES